MFVVVVVFYQMWIESFRLLPVANCVLSRHCYFEVGGKWHDFG